MTAAELRLARETLGVPAQWLADRLNVTLRTVRRWESTGPVSAHAAAVTRDLLRAQDEFVDAVVAALSDDNTAGETDLWVSTYANDDDYHAEHPDLLWPASWHRAAMARAARALPGVRVTYLREATPDD